MFKATLTACAATALATAATAQAYPDDEGPITIAGMCLLSETLIDIDELPAEQNEVNKFLSWEVYYILRAVENPDYYFELFENQAANADEIFKLSKQRMADCLKPLTQQSP